MEKHKLHVFFAQKKEHISEGNKTIYAYIYAHILGQGETDLPDQKGCYFLKIRVDDALYEVFQGVGFYDAQLHYKATSKGYLDVACKQLTLDYLADVSECYQALKSLNH